LPMVVFSSIRLGPTPELYALATIVVALVSTGLVAAGIFGRLSQIKKFGLSTNKFRNSWE
jgi:putrescine transport system permease protein